MCTVASDGANTDTHEFVFCLFCLCPQPNSQSHMRRKGNRDVSKKDTSILDEDSSE